MKIIIDGYNLLMSCGFVDPSRIGPGTLQRARTMLSGVLTQNLSAELHAETFIVFDSSFEADLPANDSSTDSIQVRFANHYEDADSMIEDMIGRHSAPRNLLVVSSDHRIQQAAQRRKASFQDSDDWFFDLIDGPKKEEPAKRKRTIEELMKSNDVAPSPQETETWTDLFSESIDEETSARNREQAKPDANKERGNERTTTWNPFPDDYADDLMDS